MNIEVIDFEAVLTYSQLKGIDLHAQTRRSLVIPGGASEIITIPALHGTVYYTAEDIGGNTLSLRRSPPLGLYVSEESAQIKRELAGADDLNNVFLKTGGHVLLASDEYLIEDVKKDEDDVRIWVGLVTFPKGKDYAANSPEKPRGMVGV